MDFDPPWTTDEPMRAASQPIDQRSTVQELQNRIERQHLMLQTLCRVLVAKGIVQEQELNEWLRYVDGLDGRVDGKLSPPRSPRACDGCKRINPPTAAKCQYCGREFEARFLDHVEG